MSLNVYRRDPETDTIRSAGDPPGLLIVKILENPGRAAFAVDPKLLPGLVGEQEGELGEYAVEVDVADVVDGLEDLETAQTLWTLAGRSFVAASPALIAPGDFDVLRSFVDLLEELRLALEPVIEQLGGEA